MLQAFFKIRSQDMLQAIPHLWINLVRRFLTALLSMLVISVATTATAIAAPLTILFTGSGDGVVGTTAFTDAAYTVELTTADTSTWDRINPDVSQIPVTTATVNIAGVGTAVIQVPTQIFINSSTRFAGWSLVAGLDLMDVINDSFQTWEGTTSLGPFTDVSVEALSQFRDISSSLGDLSLVSSSPVTWQAITGTGSPELSGTPTTGMVGVPYSFTPGLNVDATQPVAFEVDPATPLPVWLNIDAATGTVSGTPTEHGLFNFTVVATNAIGNARLPIALTVAPATLAITPPAHVPDATVGKPYSLQLQATGGVAPYRWAATGLPAGLTIDDTGLIAGTPTDVKLAEQTGGTGQAKAALAVTITVTDEADMQATQTLTLTANAAPAPVIEAKPVPTLGTWALALLSVLAAGLGLQAQRRKRKA
jgi:hypothetical protein